MNKVVEVSPTALQNLDYCERQFGFHYWSGIQVPRDASLTLGEEVHTQIELYLKTGDLDYVKNNKAATIAAKGLALLPKPKLDGLSIEGAFKFKLEDVTFSGRMDWTYPWQVIDRLFVVVGDNKTSSDPSRWAKTPEQLDKDFQAIIYGYYGLTKFPQADGVMCKWVYFPTKNKGKATPVEHTFSTHELTEKMSNLLTPARRVVHLRLTKPDPNTLQPNTNHCNAFKGCPYRSVCKLTPSDTLRSFFKMTTQTTQTTLEALRARLGGAPAATQPASHKPEDVNPPEAKVQAPATIPAPAPVQEEAKPEPQKEEKPKAAAKPKAPKPAKVPPVEGLTLGGNKVIGVLYVNCIPNVPYILASDFIAQAKADLREGTKTEALPEGVADYRVIEFGKGAGFLAALIEEKVKAAGFIQRLVLDATTPEGAVARESLQNLAAEIVRGVA